MDDDNFYDLQDDWKAEIDETLHEIREREKVRATRGCRAQSLLFVGHLISKEQSNYCACNLLCNRSGLWAVPEIST